jgi:hypothetical protein
MGGRGEKPMAPVGFHRTAVVPAKEKPRLGSGGAEVTFAGAKFARLASQLHPMPTGATRANESPARREGRTGQVWDKHKIATCVAEARLRQSWHAVYVDGATREAQWIA